jgi:hypothetical protein
VGIVRIRLNDLLGRYESVVPVGAFTEVALGDSDGSAAQYSEGADR